MKLLVVQVAAMAVTATGQIYGATVAGVRGPAGGTAAAVRLYGAGVATPGAVATPRVAATPTVVAAPSAVRTPTIYGGVGAVGATPVLYGGAVRAPHATPTVVVSAPAHAPAPVDDGADDYLERRFAVEQAHYELDHILTYNNPAAFWFWEEAGAFPGTYSQFTDIWSLGALADSYGYNVDKYDHAIDHWYRTGSTDYDALYSLELDRDAEAHSEDAWRTYRLGTLGPEYQIFENLADFDFLRRRELNRINSEHAVDLARDAYYSDPTHDHYDALVEAHRAEYVDSKEELGVRFRMYDWLSGGSLGWGDAVAYPFVQATRSDLDRARYLAHEAEEEYYMNPSDETYRDWYLADLDEESEQYEHYARIGSLIGSDLFSVWGWWKQAQVDEDYDWYVHDSLGDHGGYYYDY